MFCARCGTENPDDGKFCRSCGGRIGLIDDNTAGSGKTRSPSDEKARQTRLRSGSRKFIWGLFALVASLFFGIPLKGTGYADLLLLPGMLLIVWAMADFIRLRTGTYRARSENKPGVAGSSDNSTNTLPPKTTVFAEDEIRPAYDTGEMVPQSVTEDTTRELDLDQTSTTTKLGKD